MRRPPTLIDYSADWQDELVRMWRESFEFGVGIKDPNPLAHQTQYFNTVVVPHNQVRLALIGSKLVGFVAASPKSISQLYVRVGFHRQGVGSLLLNWAKSESSGSLWLYTFERNQNAQRFYEHHGFHVEERGFEPNWQLNDIKYTWSAQAACGPELSDR